MRQRIVDEWSPAGRRQGRKGSLAISAAVAASRLAAKPLMCLVYE